MFNTSLYIAVPLITAFWLVIGGVVPWFIPKGPNRGIIQTMLVTTAVCCYVLTHFFPVELACHMNLQPNGSKASFISGASHIGVWYFVTEETVTWLVAFLAQLNPLIGPTVANDIAAHMRQAWVKNPPVSEDHPCFPRW